MMDSLSQSTGFVSGPQCAGQGGIMRLAGHCKDIRKHGLNPGTCGIPDRKSSNVSNAAAGRSRRLHVHVRPDQLQLEYLPL